MSAERMPDRCGTAVSHIFFCKTTTSESFSRTGLIIDRNAVCDTPETLGRRPARMAGTRVRAGQRLGPLGGLYAGTAGGGALRLRVPHDPRARHAAHRQAHQSHVGRRSVQPRRAEPFVQRRQRRRAGDRSAGGFRRAVRSPDDRDAAGRGLYRRGGIPLYQCRALCGFPNRFGASRMAEQADQGAQADRAGHCQR